MFRFAFRGRWLAAGIGIVVVAAVCVRLGIWQLDRLDQRRDFNRLVEDRGAAAPAPVNRLLPVSAHDVGAGEHRRVIASGTFDGDHEMLVLAKALVGTPGQHVLTPLVLDDGTAVLVERGFVPVVDPEAAVPVNATAPGGAVRIQGVLHAGESGGRFLAAPADAAGTGTIGHVTRIDVERIGEELPYDLRAGYIRVEAELSEGARLVPTPLPPTDLGDGPHLGYAVQWFSFATVFLGGWIVLVRHTASRRGADL